MVVVKYSSIESNLYRSMHPDKAGWTLTNQLLAIIADVLRWIQWSKTKDGSKNRNQPDPIARPGVETGSKQMHPGAKGLPLSQIRKMFRPNRADAPTLAKLFTPEQD